MSVVDHKYKNGKHHVIANVQANPMGIKLDQIGWYRCELRLIRKKRSDVFGHASGELEAA